jgi:DNA-binding transcriptional ArsR family regulator
MERLPAQQPGELVLLSPDRTRAAAAIRTRCLYTRHETLDDQAIEALADRLWCSRFQLADKRADPVLATCTAASAALSDRPVPAADVASGHQFRLRVGSVSPPPREEDTVSNPQQLQHVKLLARTSSMTVSEFALSAKITEAVARRSLKQLVEIGLVRDFKQGRAMRYWAVENGLRPDLGLTEPIRAFVPAIEQDQAERIGNSLRRRLMQRVLGRPEEVVETGLIYCPMIRIRYQERVGSPIWKRALGSKDFEVRVRHAYLQSRTLQLLAYDPEYGLRTHEQARSIPKEHVRELEDLSPLQQLLPGSIVIDDRDWHQRKRADQISARSEAAFQAEIKTLETILFPVWQLQKRRLGEDARRLTQIDALGGKALNDIL